jgi:hypothetical protein
MIWENDSKLKNQFEEHIKHISNLTNENLELKKENKGLQEKLVAMEDSIALQVERAVAQAIAPLKDELVKAYNEIARLNAIINKDSSNSSKPSSKNGFKNIPNSREKSGRTQGGQKGHAGYRLKLPENMVDLEEKGLIETRVVDHTDGQNSFVSRYTIDLEMKVIITEHRFSEGNVPKNLHNEVTYGEDLKAKTMLLLTEGIVAEKRLSKILSSFTHGVVNLSTGTIDNIKKEFAEKLVESKELDVIKQDLLNGNVMNTDDTSMRSLERIVYTEKKDDKSEVTEDISYEKADKKSFRITVRTHSNEQSTMYTVNPKKDNKGILRDDILPRYDGSLCHDYESKFFNHGKNNGACGAHLIRDLKGLNDLYKCTWAMEMRSFILEMNDYKNADLDLGVSFCDAEKLAYFEEEYDKQLQNGFSAIGQLNKNDTGYKEFNAILNRLTKSKDNYMLFMKDYEVPFTNNLAERDLRREKTAEKISGLFRSWEGAVNHTRTQSFISTTKKRGMDLLQSIKKVFVGEPVLTPT